MGNRIFNNRMDGRERVADEAGQGRFRVIGGVGWVARRWWVWAVLVLIAVPVGSRLWVRHLGNVRAAEREERIRELVHIGMPEAEARAVLVDAGFGVGPTNKPTSEDYYTMHVPIRRSISIESSIAYTITGRKTVFSQKRAVTIVLDDQHLVTAVR